MLESGVGEDLLDGLTEAQRAAVVSEAAPLCILASAGAGKTRVLTRRIAYRVRLERADARHTLALTFTRKAAGEMQSRLGKLGLRENVAAGTFHSLASSQLQRWWADRRETAPTLLERKGRLLGPLAGSRPGLSRVPIAELAGHIEWAKARMIGPDLFEEESSRSGRRLPTGVTGEALAGLYARYEDEKVRRGLIDFDDLLARCAGAIESDPAFAGAQRWRWRHVYVDEFQDLNPLQHRLLLAWLGPSTDICVVGDPNQSIYGWNGADPMLLAEMPRRWPTTEILRLDANHRCTAQIVTVAAAVLGADGVTLTSAGREGAVPGVRSFPSESAEAVGIATAVRQAHSGGRPWRSMAVLARTNAQLIVIQKALAGAGIPSWTPSQSALLDDPTARQVLADLRRAPSRLIQAVLVDLDEMIGEARGPQPPGESTPGALRAAMVIDDGAAAALGALADLARAYTAHEPSGQVAQWLAWLPTVLGDGSERSGSGDQVTLCSFHRAKGLEWSAVWVAGLENGLVPIGRALSDTDEAEERRLLYVALTRAGDELHCSWSRQRTFGTRSVPREPSPWLELIEGAGGDSVGPDTDGPERSWRSTLAEQKSQLRKSARAEMRVLKGRSSGDGPEADAELVRTIKSWRLETARASGVPAYLVLHDATVEALASLRPRTAQQLLAVPGLGPVKASRYGPSLLSMVADRAESA